MRNKIFSVLCAIVFLLMEVRASQAQVPRLINYQGYITDNSGNPINGTCTIQFSIYDA
jgi:hypothetical protein